MHRLSVLILGPNSFISTIDELKTYLKFNPSTDKSDVKHDLIFYHEEALKDNKNNELIMNSNSLKVCASNRKKIDENSDAFLELPCSLKEINSVIESVAARKKYSINSSIKIKNYLLNKNERKLFKDDAHIILTEKEVQLLDLFLEKKKPISKDDILSSVWNYSSDADTHTVETHIYRLRKKINEKFSDDNFILNKKEGYSL
tara:strand:- start:1 stop:606 length:606 start_codon:yes stop_codon:yes gene_type:complete